MDDAETKIQVGAADHFYLLQWGRVMDDAETPRLHPPWIAASALQWGRVMDDAETADPGVVQSDPVVRASMGPRHG